MKRNTRKEILDTAKALFNERGFNQVGIRDIADALGISNGNVTYHFKKKEDMLEALLFEDAPNDTKPETAPATPEALDAFILDMQQAVQNNAFYFWHYTQLSQLSPRIHEKQKERYLLNTKLLGEAFAGLHKSGHMRQEQYTSEYQTIIDALLISSVYWMPFSRLKGEAATTYRAHAWGIIYTLLTESGQIFADNILPHCVGSSACI